MIRMQRGILLPVLTMSRLDIPDIADRHHVSKNNRSRANILDSNLDVVLDYIKKVYGELLTNVNLIRNNKDPKSILQEYCQGKFLPLPNYNTTEVKDKFNTFETVCSINGIKNYGYGKGTTKKNSHQSAAEMMLEQLKVYFD